MPTFSDAQRRARRRAITDAARRCFTRNTYAATTMADIVKESGLTARVVAAMFATKEDVMRHVAVTLIQESVAEIVEVTRRRPLVQPTDLIHELAQAAGIRSRAPLRIRAWADFLADPELADPIQRYAEQQMELMTEYAQAWLESSGQTPEDAARRADGVATVLVGLLNGALMLLAIDQTMTVSRFLDAVRWIDLVPDDETLMRRTPGRT